MRIKYLVFAALAVMATIAGANYFLLQRPAQLVLKADPRNEGIAVFAHFEYFVIPTTLVFDLRELSSTNSPADVTRVLLQFARATKDQKFSMVKLAHQGRSKFMLNGEYFQNLGTEFGDQNPIYTMRTFPENVYKLDGTAAFGTWTGGWLGVMGKQMEDFNDFHKQWYVNDLAMLGN